MDGAEIMTLFVTDLKLTPEEVERFKRAWDEQLKTPQVLQVGRPSRVMDTQVIEIIFETIFETIKPDQRDGDLAIFSANYGSGPVVINVRELAEAVHAKMCDWEIAFYERNPL